MAKLRVKIDLSLLRENLSQEDRQPTSESQVRQFLLDSGFIPDGELWTVDEKDLGQLKPSEVLEVEPLE
jgi:hypothetical protein